MKAEILSDTVQGVTLSPSLNLIIVSRAIVLGHGGLLLATVPVQEQYKITDDFSELDAETMATVDRLWTPAERQTAQELAAQAAAAAEAEARSDAEKATALRVEAFNKALDALRDERAAAHDAGELDDVQELDGEIARLTALRDQGGEPAPPAPAQEPAAGNVAGELEPMEELAGELEGEPVTLEEATPEAVRLQAFNTTLGELQAARAQAHDAGEGAQVKTLDQEIARLTAMRDQGAPFPQQEAELPADDQDQDA